MKHAILLFSLALASTVLAADAEVMDYDKPRKIAALTDPAIEESSGLAWSWENTDILWTCNDSGDSARFFAVNLTGTYMGEFRVEGDNKDWEDMCSFRTERENYLLLADVGDNDEKRNDYKLYLVKEPTLKKKPQLGKVETLKPFAVIPFTYEDGKHNCEAVGVDVKSGKIILVSKVLGLSCKAYELPLPLRREKGPFVAKPIATLNIPIVTAMDISPDGLRAIVLTYGDAYEYTRGEKESWADAFARKPRVIEMPLRRQGETICYGADGKTLYLTSEGKFCPLFMVPVKKKE